MYTLTMSDTESYQSWDNDSLTMSDTESCQLRDSDCKCDVSLDFAPDVIREIINMYVRGDKFRGWKCNDVAKFLVTADTNGIDFTQIELRDISFCDLVGEDVHMLEEIDFSGSKFINCNFDGIEPHSCKFDNCHIEGCDLDYTIATYCSYIDVVIASCSMDDIGFERCNFNDATFTGCNMDNAHLLDVTCDNIVFSRCQLRYLDLSGEIGEVYFVSCDLSDGKLYADWESNVVINKGNISDLYISDAGHVKFYEVDMEDVEINEIPEENLTMEKCTSRPKFTKRQNCGLGW